MAWIESHQSLGTHLKLKRLARELRIHRAQAIGHLHLLWWWALDNAPSGDLSALTSAEIAEAADWPGTAPDQFVAALRLHRWLDDDGRIHDWAEYAGKLIGKRILDRERKRSVRIVGVVPGTSDGIPADVHGNSDGCPTDVAGTVPNQPNQQNLAERAPDPPPGFVPPLKRSEFEALADHLGVPKACASWCWDVYEARGWVDKHGQPIRNCAPVLRRAVIGWQQKEAMIAARSSSTGSDPAWARKKRADELEERVREHSANPSSRAYVGDEAVTPELRAEWEKMRAELKAAREAQKQ